MTTMNNNAIETAKAFSRNLLSEYDYEWTDDGIDTIYRVWAAQKANLIEMFAKHPNWDAENFRIVFDANFRRERDQQKVDEFAGWAYSSVRTLVLQKGKRTFRGMNGRDFNNAYERIDGRRDALINLIAMSRRPEAALAREFADVNEEYKLFRAFVNATVEIRDDEYNRIRVTPETATTIQKADRFLDTIRCYKMHIVDDDMHDSINDIYPGLCVVGQKVSKVVTKWAKMVGLDKVKDLRECTVPNNDGTFRTFTKDYGWFYYQAMMGDAINPLDITRYTVISLNPNDYWTMSFGHNWASCHTIDKENKKGVGANHYSGCYSSGTESYMLDSSTVIFYTVDKKVNRNDIGSADKMQRCNFHINRDGSVIVQGRVYPDGRDGGEQGYATQFRNIVQMVVSTCTGENNIWTVKKGTSACSEHIVEDRDKTNYSDYFHYGDCNVSLLQGRETYDKVYIGHAPICPNCGEEHDSEEWITCEDCREGCNCVHCARCGERINLDRDEYIYDEDTGNYYCD